MGDENNFFSQPVKIMEANYDDLRQISTSQNHNCTTGHLREFSQIKENYNIKKQIKASKKLLMLT